MLNSISWEQFFTTILIVVGGYYVVSTLLLFGDEIKSLFSQKQSNETNNSEGDEPSGVTENNALVGHARPRESTIVDVENTVDAQFVVVENSVEVDDEPMDVVTQANVLAKASRELCAEVKSLIAEFAPKSLDEIHLAIKPLLSRYAFLYETEHRQSINQFLADHIRESTPLAISQSDADALWSGS